MHDILPVAGWCGEMAGISPFPVHIRVQERFGFGMSNVEEQSGRVSLVVRLGARQ